MSKIYELSNVLPDLPDERDYIFASAKSATALPEIIDHRKYAREIENQGITGSCVANATVSALELLHKKSKKDINLSRLFLYYNLREQYAHLKDKDTGSYTRDGFKSVSQVGICTEETWKFDVGKVNTKPDDKSYLEAKNHKVQRYERIPTTYDDDMVHHTKVALAKGYPVLIGMTLGKTFYSISGSLENHNYKGVQWDSIGGHAMNIVGYNNTLNGFIVENSWGSSWGDSGFCLISYDVFKKDCKDVWVCTKFKDIEIEEEFIVPPVEPVKPTEPVKPVEPAKPKSKSKKKLIPLIVGGLILISGAVYYFL